MASDSAVLFVNGEVPSLEAARAVLHAGDLLIAVDGGLRHARALGLLPHWLVGDLDSIHPEEREEMVRAGVQVRRYPPEKDDTDLELAIRLALEADCTRLRLIGALGGRVDHLLGNLYLLLDPALERVDIRLDDGLDEAFVIRGEARVEGQPGDLVSLLPLLGEATGVETDGLYYPLRSETLYPYRTRGISNVMQANLASVRLQSGVLLCIHRRVQGMENLP